MKDLLKGKRIWGYAVLFALCLSLFAVPVLAADNSEHSTKYNGVDYARVFDYDYYTTKRHPELAGKKDSVVLKYFVTKGMKKGERAIETFSPKSYRNANRDLRGQYGDDYEKYYEHYINVGYKQSKRADTLTGWATKIKDPVTSYNGKSYSRVYDFEYYMKMHPELKKYKLDDYGLIKYFVTKGIPQRHRASKNFYVKWYYNANPDLRYAYGTRWIKYYRHYQKKGYKKGAVRRTTKLVDPIDYIKIDGQKIDLSKIYSYDYYTKHTASARRFRKNKDDKGAVMDFVKNGMKLFQRGNAKYDAFSKAYQKTVKKIYPEGLTEEDKKAHDEESDTKYLILLNLGKYRVSIFKGKKNNWRLIRSFRCTIGAPGHATPSGVFRLGYKGRYFNSGSSIRCWYYSEIRGSILFHSVLYAPAPTPARVIEPRLGLKLSHGCVRLAIENAKYIYEKIPKGTKIISYNSTY